MQNYQDTKGGIHALSDTDIANGGLNLLPNGYISISPEQAFIILNPALNTTEQQKNIEIEIQKALDINAQACGYDDIKSACTYASTMPWVPDTDPHFAMCEKFRRQGNYAQNRMSLTWAMCYAYLATVQAGVNPMPTPSEAVAMMPQFIWPN